MKPNNDNEYSGLQELINTEVQKNFNQHIVHLSLRSVLKPKKVIDFGAGIGTLSKIFIETYDINPICLEIDSKNTQMLLERNLEVVKSLESLPSDTDLIFSSNVLEHIEDDLSILELMYKNLRNQGHIFLFLPAKQMLWSKLDEILGHYRRYEVSDIKLKCQKAGFQIKEVYFVDSGGFFASCLMKLLGYNPDSGIGSQKSLIFYDKWLFPVSKVLDSLGMKYLVGKNIAILAQKNI